MTDVLAETRVVFCEHPRLPREGKERPVWAEDNQERNYRERGQIPREASQ